jgi:hypothetical protein
MRHVNVLEEDEEGPVHPQTYRRFMHYNKPHHVYRYFAEDDTLLYVGCSYDLKARHKQHSKTAAWFAEANRRSHETFEDRWTGLVAERVAIMVNRPVYNKTHNYWLPTDPELTRELHRLATQRPGNAAELLTEIEARLLQSEIKAQHEREAQWNDCTFDQELYDQLISIGVTTHSAARRARRPRQAA